MSIKEKIKFRARRLALGYKYAQIAMRLKPYDKIPQYLWTLPILTTIVETLEDESELDTEFSEVLILSGDVETYAIHKELEEQRRTLLWDLKERLYLTKRSLNMA